MKILTTNFLTCAVKSCKSSPSSFPLHFKDASLLSQEIDYNPTFIRNILPRINYAALQTTATELSLQTLLPEQSVFESAEEGKEVDDETLKTLHKLLLETMVQEGKLVCRNCGFEYPIKEGVGNFLLPSHLV